MRLIIIALSLGLVAAACGKSPKPQAPAPPPTTAEPAADAAPEPAADTAEPPAADVVTGATTADGASMSDTSATPQTNEGEKILLDQFADIRILRFVVPGWDALPAKTRVLLYHLHEAALVARDIYWDQRHPQGLRVKRTLEAIDKSYSGDKSSADYQAFMVYLKRVWFSSGFYHHYSNKKFLPEFSKEYFAELVAKSDPAALPLSEGETPADLTARLTPLLFDPEVDPVMVNFDPGADLVADSYNNFYGRDVTQAEVEAFYAEKKKNAGDEPPMFGLNSKLVKNAGGALEERVWKIGGMYGAALEKAVVHLEAALALAENDAQRAWMAALIKYYRSGDLEDFDAFNIAWVEDTESSVDLIHGFIETYDDAMDMRAAYESIVELKDDEASQRIATISANAQWFEDHMPYMPAHRKEAVKGISARVVSTVTGSGACGPHSPVGVNLPNSDWIRKNHGSKSITIGNLMTAYEEAKIASGVLEEFSPDDEVLARAKEHGALAHLLDIDMHEVIGHASGQLEPGVLPMADTLKNYSSTLEEARADLVALYYIPDPKLAELGLVKDPDVAKAAYDSFIRVGIMTQLARVPPGEDIQEAHMRNRQLIAKWAFEKGGPEVIERIEKAPGKTAFVIRDYDALRTLFGELLKEIQRIKSQGDFEAGQKLVETYGVKVDQALHEEVRERWAELGVAPYSGFVNPRITPIEKGGEIVDAKIEYVGDFADQMRDYAARYSVLPLDN